MKTFDLHPKRLEQYGFKAYSQNDEDGILAEIFKRISVTKGTFCEIGVENGLECNSLFLIHQGWRGVWLEGNENQRPAIESKFQSLLANNRLSLAIGYITPQNINTALAEVAGRLDVGTNGLDFLSIDIDGMDIYLLEALEHSPKVICNRIQLEISSTLVEKSPVFNGQSIWNRTDYMGSQLDGYQRSRQFERLFAGGHKSDRTQRVLGQKRFIEQSFRREIDA